jgi:hypothetical protein
MISVWHSLAARAGVAALVCLGLIGRLEVRDGTAALADSAGSGLASDGSVVPVS